MPRPLINFARPESARIQDVQANSRLIPIRAGNSWNHCAIVFAIILFSSVIITERLHTRLEPMDPDLCLYAVIAHQLRFGARLYNDVWELKPPGVMWTYEVADWLVGNGPREMLALGVFAAIGTLLGIYRVGATVGGARGGVLAAGLWTATCSDLNLDANQPNCEAFINLCVVWMLYTLVKESRGNLVARGLAAGLLLGVASLYKQFLVIDGLVVAFAFLTLGAAEGGRRRALAGLAASAGVLALMWLLTLAYLATHQGLDGFFKMIFVADRAYAGTPAQILVKSLSWNNIFPWILYFLIPLLALILAAIPVAARGPFRRQWAVLGVLALCTFADVALPGQYQDHYYQLWLPLACIAGGWSATLLSAALNARSPRLASLPWVAAALILLSFAGHEWSFFRLPPDDWSVRQYGSDVYVQGKDIGLELGHNLPPNSTLYQWGSDFEIYFYSRMIPASNVASTVLAQNPVLFGFKPNPLYDFFTRRFRSDLTLRHPDVVVVCLRYGAMCPNLRWLLERYQRFPGISDQGDFVLLVRRGSILQSQLEAAANLRAAG